jgi:hypothetical protein
VVGSSYLALQVIRYGGVLLRKPEQVVSQATGRFRCRQQCELIGSVLVLRRSPSAMSFAGQRFVPWAT